MMNHDDRRPETRPKTTDTTLQRRGEHDLPVDNQQPVPDGEAIAEIGDAVGGPA
jgi:hypothetical protein